MKTSTKIIIGSSLAVLITGGVILSVSLAKKRKVKKECEDRDGVWDKDKKMCINSDGSSALESTQTVGDIGKEVRTEPTLGYTNVRTSPEVDDGALGTWFGYRPTEGNFLGKVTTNPVGKIISSLTGNDGYFWYKINLTKAIDGKTVGFVRQDAVSF
jgi:hypothetical protein